jgi:hypothetical protein
MENGGIGNPTAAVQTQFDALRQSLSSNQWWHKRNNRKTGFRRMLDIIRQFNEQPDGHGPLRYQLTGVCHLLDAIAFDIDRLREWIGKSKSSLNGSLKILGYLRVKVADCGNLVDEFLTKIPNLRTDGYKRLRWTIRTIPQPCAPPTDPVFQHGAAIGVGMQTMGIDVERSEDDDIDGLMDWDQ